jgi:hypothetical protein
MIIINRLKQIALTNSLLEVQNIQNNHSDLSYLGQFKLGCSVGGLSFCSKPFFAIAAIAITAITYACNYLFYFAGSEERNNLNGNAFLQNVVVLPVVTEILFRGVIQNSLRQIQEVTKSHRIPSQIQSKIITSPMTMILAPNMLLALYIAQQSYLRAALVAFYPTGSILHFMTGDKICAPIAANVTSSFIAFTLFNMYKLCTAAYFV